MIQKPYILHALSPLHAGVGQAAGLIDLPIARLKGSGIPFLPGSSIKGVLRDECMGRPTNDLAEQTKEVEAVFGPNFQNGGSHAGALTCTDARLLALPVRSFLGTFAYVTSPLLLTLAARDLDLPKPLPIPVVPENSIIAAPKLVDVSQAGSRVYLEDLDRTLSNLTDGGWLNLLATVFGTTADDQRIFRDRFAIVGDETMTFLWETATQLDQRVRIDPKTRTVATGALWLEESLPPETLLIGLLLAESSRHPTKRMTPDQVLTAALKAGTRLQFGGKSTVGRGRCRMVQL